MVHCHCSFCITKFASAVHEPLRKGGAWDCRFEIALNGIDFCRLGGRFSAETLVIKYRMLLTSLFVGIFHYDIIALAILGKYLPNGSILLSCNRFKATGCKSDTPVSGGA